MKRNSWFILKIEKSWNMQSFSWATPRGGKKKFIRDAEQAIKINPGQAFSTQINVNLQGAFTDKRMYWRDDAEQTDPLEGESVWTEYRREGRKFQAKIEAEKFAYELTQRFPPYIGIVMVERLRWNPDPKGPIAYPGPSVQMALAT